MFRMQLETSSPQDATLVAQALKGDQDAYGLLVQRHSRSLFALAYRVTGNQDDADEVVQETFLKAYRSLARFEQRSNFGTWLYRIAMNCALDLKTKKRPEVGAMQVSEDPEPGEYEVQLASAGPSQDQLVFGAQVKEKISAAIKLLTKTERAAFVMRHLEGRSIDEIAAVLGQKPNATKNSIFRAVQKMRQELGPLVSAR
jgi:RNA polymerase sigma-70 factor (ECF subfamily)